MEEDDKPWCCHCDQETLERCPNPPVFDIWPEDPTRRYDGSQACPEHVGALLGSGGEYEVTAWRVVTIGSE